MQLGRTEHFAPREQVGDPVLNFLKISHLVRFYSVRRMGSVSGENGTILITIQADGAFCPMRASWRPGLEFAENLPSGPFFLGQKDGKRFGRK